NEDMAFVDRNDILVNCEGGIYSLPKKSTITSSIVYVPPTTNEGADDDD
ncbi:MAG: hypothetical protein JWM86_791, partial [Thermoleophilia bacterium]|nr:hypothetical protein [Thermoleophilia bacterium]